MKSFNELSIKPPIQKALQDLGFETPSPIQAEALPVLLGPPTDFIGLAATGTGKTASFGIPMLEQVDPTINGPQFLVMCPTRELALQVSGQIDLLGKHLGVRSLAVYGGSDYTNQIRGLRSGVSIVGGTPGRLIDHLERGNLKLNHVKAIVLDEADEMISMGFKEDLEKVLESVKRNQSRIWLFSATMSAEVRRVANTYLNDPQQVRVNQTNILSTTVEQFYYPTRESDKAEILCKIIENVDDFYGLIFCQTKSLVVDLTSFLTDRGYKVDSLHGNKDQRAREKTMQSFRDRKVTILICTDVASRGLDVNDVTHVINYSIPRELDHYVHRIGRTARGGKSGIAISLVTPSHRGLIRRIETMTKSKMQEGRIPSRREIGIKKITKNLATFLNQKNHQRAMDLLQDDWKNAISEMSSEEIVGRFLALISPDVFEDKPKVKAALGPHHTTDKPRGRTSFRGRSRPHPRSESGGGPKRKPRRFQATESKGQGPKKRFKVKKRPQSEGLSRKHLQAKRRPKPSASSASSSTVH